MVVKGLRLRARRGSRRVSIVARVLFPSLRDLFTTCVLRVDALPHAAGEGVGNVGCVGGALGRRVWIGGWVGGWSGVGGRVGACVGILPGSLHAACCCCCAVVSLGLSFCLLSVCLSFVCFSLLSVSLFVYLFACSSLAPSRGPFFFHCGVERVARRFF